MVGVICADISPFSSKMFFLEDCQLSAIFKAPTSITVTPSFIPPLSDRLDTTLGLVMKMSVMRPSDSVISPDWNRKKLNSEKSNVHHCVSALTSGSAELLRV